MSAFSVGVRKTGGRKSMKQQIRRAARRWLAVVLCLCMAFPSAATVDTAQGQAYTGGLCPHHPRHTKDCGYEKAREGSPCRHKHTEDCYAWVTECVHEHTDACYEESGSLPKRMSASMSMTMPADTNRPWRGTPASMPARSAAGCRMGFFR